MMNGKSSFEDSLKKVSKIGTDFEKAFKTYNKKQLEETNVISISELFQKQIGFQELIVNHPFLPVDDPKWYSYHVLAMMEELGEILKADKRWKTHRNERFEPEEKLDEIADVFITIMNICIFSNIDSKTLLQAVSNKINSNIEKLKG